LYNGCSTDDELKGEHYVFSTIRVLNGHLCLWAWHEERLKHDAVLVQHSWKHTRVTLIQQLAAELGEGCIRISCTPDGWWIHSWRPIINEDRALSSSWIYWEHRASLPPDSKHGYRKRATRIKAQKGVDVLLWKNQNEDVLESSFGNLFTIRDERVYTPKADGRILNGIGRRLLIKAAESLGIEVVECALTVDEQWWMTSALRCIQRLDISGGEDAMIPILRRQCRELLLDGDVED